jgi:multiple sugar transport system permease protein
MNVILNSMAGYALARIEFPGKQKFYYAVLAILMVPGQILIIPNFIILKQLGMLNEYSAIIVPGAINASYIFMMRQFFLSFPKELEEAAQIDGLNRLQIFIRIVIPLVMPVLGTQFLFIFLGSWNNFMGPRLYLNNPDKWTLPRGLASLVSETGNIDWSLQMASSMFSLIPILIMYIVLNRHFIKGMDISGGK